MQKFTGFQLRSRVPALIKTAVTVSESGFKILSYIAEAGEYCIYIE